ncbi:MAG TPA: SH3 domain-containing protein [Leptospiraceae bacterium]|nr:SH3 domain-containing protein [Leptospiraceae bacterium]HNF27029.1 SH3 domain-containing protein [Leptospiraceae bacterium]HNH09056.1 SH3 domain-containing protein [Leptospiraceae bacterium]HNI94774.1 SH3 domain-containing protein [Leptospiraceae bacterium]HNM03915.1 SH3 domain-containing protein [Leptospiraceae bacterium]
MKHLFFILLVILFSDCRKTESSAAPSANSSGSVPDSHVSSDRRQYVTVDSLKLRSKPDLKAETVALLEKGDSFYVTEESSNETEYEGNTSRWGKIKFRGKEGWVFLAFVSFDPPSMLSDAEKEKIQKAYEDEVSRQEKELERQMKADPNFQSCSPPGCGILTAELANAEKGCKKYKREEINALSKENRLEYENLESYKDDYCKYFGMRIQSQCPVGNW